MSIESILSKEEILSEYYRKFYHKVLFDNKCQSIGMRYFDSKLEKYWKRRNVLPKKVLEVGFASGEHVSKVREFPTEEYIGLDINPPVTKIYLNQLPPDKRQKVKFVQADAAKMPFADKTFDRVISTCLLHHVKDPLDVLQEIRRVATHEGEIAIAMPTDPGLLNRFVKFLVTYRSMRKLGIHSPKLIYALEHQNQIGGLIELVNYVFRMDNLKVSYLPFLVPSWNLNLMVVIHVTVNKERK